MQVTLNDTPHTLKHDATVADLLTQLGIDPRGIAVELGGAIVPRSQHALQALADGDRLELVTLIGGG